MTTRTHTTMEIDLGVDDSGVVTLDISGIFERGERERGPTYSSGGEPGYPDSWDDIIAELDGCEIDLDSDQLRRAERALMDEVRMS